MSFQSSDVDRCQQRLSSGSSAQSFDVQQGSDQREISGKIPWRYWLLFLYLGVLSLAAFNFFLTVTGYFDNAFAGRHWAFVSTMTNSGMTLFATGLMFAVGQNVPVLIWYYLSLSTMMISTVLIPTLALWHRSSAWSFGAAVGVFAALGFATGTMQSLISGLAAQEHPQCMGGVMAGQGISGVMAPLAEFLSRSFSAIPSPVYLMSFFGICCVMLVGGFPLGSSIPVRRRERKTAVSTRQSIGRLLLQARPQILNVFGTFVCTFLVFPGVAASWSPQLDVFTKMGAQGAYWYTTLVIGVFQIFDVVGRMSPKLPMMLGLSPSRLWILVSLRMMFVPTFMLLQRCPSCFPSPFKTCTEVLVMALLAATNGWCGTLAMMYGPEQVPGEEERVGTSMVLALVSGIFAGSLLAPFTQIGV